MSLSAVHLENAALPVVDVSGLLSDNAADWSAVADKIRIACLDKGFMYIVGHGISTDLRKAVLSQAAAFFNRTHDDKMSVNMKRSPCNRGYEEMRGQTLEAGAPPDLKESFYIGRHLEADHPDVMAGMFNRGPNQWPSDAAEFKSVMETYYDLMEKLGEAMLRGIALSLNLNADYFDGFSTEPNCGLRLVHYPPQPVNAAPDEKGCGAHTDWGALTMLLQDDIGGLQVWDDKAGWVHATPIDDTYVVNLGDMMARWTNDKYRSTLHRVVNATGLERYSVPFFYSGNPGYEVSCIPTCLDEGESPRHAPTTVEGHIKEMYARTYA